MVIVPEIEGRRVPQDSVIDLCLSIDGPRTPLSPLGRYPGDALSTTRRLLFPPSPPPLRPHHNQEHHPAQLRVERLLYHTTDCPR